MDVVKVILVVLGCGAAVAGVCGGLLYLIPDEVKHAIVTGFTILLMLFFLYMFFCSVFSLFAAATERTKEEKEKKTYKITPGRIFALIMAIVAIAFAVTTIINGNLN